MFASIMGASVPKEVAGKGCPRKKYGQVPPTAELLSFSSDKTPSRVVKIPGDVASLIERIGYSIASFNQEGRELDDVSGGSGIYNEVLLVVMFAEKDDKQCLVNATRRVRALYRTAFICVWHPDATEDPFFRQGCFGLTIEGANMVSFDLNALWQAAEQVIKTTRRTGNMTCPFCQMSGFSEDELWLHSPLYHVNCTNSYCAVVPCPVCDSICDAGQREPYPVHLRNKHGPCGRGELESETYTGLFAIVVCKRPSDGKYLMVQEFANSGFWVPGGQLDAGESLQKAVVRETIEEAGVDINLLGVLNVTVQNRGRWRRVIFYAEPSMSNHAPGEERAVNGGGASTVDGVEVSNQKQHSLPKTLPDFESTGACWVTLEEVNRGRSSLMKDQRGPLNSLHMEEPDVHSMDMITNKQLKLRGYEPLEWFNYVENGGEILPLEVPGEYVEVFSDVPF